VPRQREPGQAVYEDVDALVEALRGLGRSVGPVAATSSTTMSAPAAMAYEARQVVALLGPGVPRKASLEWSARGWDQVASGADRVEAHRPPSPSRHPRTRSAKADFQVV